MSVLVVVPAGKTTMDVNGSEHTEEWDDSATVYDTWQKRPRIWMYRASFDFDLETNEVIKNKYSSLTHT